LVFPPLWPIRRTVAATGVVVDVLKDILR